MPGIIAFFKGLLTPKCKHELWRPCIEEVILHFHGREFEGIVIEPSEKRVNRPARKCDDCGVVQGLSVQEFYAQFGRMPW